MKRIPIIATFGLFAACSFASADKISLVPLTVEELIRAIDINMTKYQIEFDEEGTISLETMGIGNSQTYQLDTPSKSATLILYYEKGPNSAGSTVKGHDTLHFWISNERGGTGAYLVFNKASAPITSAGFKDGVFRVVGFAGEDNSKEIEYSLRVTNTK